MKKVFLVSVLAVVFFSAGVLARSGGFPDVPAGAWFHGYVMSIKDWGVVSGNDDGTFAPERNINRAEFAKMLYQYDKRVDQKVANLGGNNSFTPSVMHLRKFNGEPANCPNGWKQANYGTAWTTGGREALERTCFSSSACTTMVLEEFNNEPSACPNGWKQADYGVEWEEGGRNNLRRVCYMCLEY